MLDNYVWPKTSGILGLYRMVEEKREKWVRVVLDFVCERGPGIKAYPELLRNTSVCY